MTTLRRRQSIQGGFDSLEEPCAEFARCTKDLDAARKALAQAIRKNYQYVWLGTVEKTLDLSPRSPRSSMQYCLVTAEAKRYWEKKMGSAVDWDVVPSKQCADYVLAAFRIEMEKEAWNQID